MDRADQLRDAAREQLGGRAFFGKVTPNDAGVFFGKNKAQRLVAVIHPGQIVAMSEALSDESFETFLSVLLDWATGVLARLDAGDDVDDAIDHTQDALHDLDPERYAYLSFVLDV